MDLSMKQRKSITWIGTFWKAFLGCSARMDHVGARGKVVWGWLGAGARIWGLHFHRVTLCSEDRRRGKRKRDPREEGGRERDLGGTRARREEGGRDQEPGGEAGEGEREPKGGGER